MDKVKADQKSKKHYSRLITGHLHSNMILIIVIMTETDFLLKALSNTQDLFEGQPSASSISFKINVTFMKQHFKWKFHAYLTYIIVQNTITTETSLGYYHCSKPPDGSSGTKTMRIPAVLKWQERDQSLINNRNRSYLIHIAATLRLCQRGVLIGKTHAFYF